MAASSAVTDLAIDERTETWPGWAWLLRALVWSAVEGEEDQLLARRRRRVQQKTDLGQLLEADERLGAELDG